MTDFRQKAAECYAEFKQSHDPAEAAAADAYNEAADEIERLAKELAQSATEPVGWKLVPIEPTPAMLRRGDQGQSPEYIWEAMMAVAPTPPRPDTSAGLIEAAETELNKIRDCMVEDRGYYDGLIGFAGDIEVVAAMLRARAADRNGK